MKRLTCFIVDDEPLAIDVIQTYVARVDYLEALGSTTDPVRALREVRELQPDLLFIDIEMPGLGGLDLIRTLKHPPAIIITTAYREYAVEGFELNVLDYLVKPIAFDRFLQALEKYEDGNPSDSNSFILVKANRKQVRIPVRDILYIEGLKDYVRIRLDKEEVLTKLTLTEILQDLPDGEFIRVHKSFIIAKSGITAFTATDIEIGKFEIPIGRTYKDTFLKLMHEE